jgi:hypothetical protein
LKKNFEPGDEVIYTYTNPEGKTFTYYLTLLAPGATHKQFGKCWITSKNDLHYPEKFMKLSPANGTPLKKALSE